MQCYRFKRNIYTVSEPIRIIYYLIISFNEHPPCIIISIRHFMLSPSSPLQIGEPSRWKNIINYYKNQKKVSRELFIFHYEYNQDDFIHLPTNVTVQHEISVENILCRICAMHDCYISETWWSIILERSKCERRKKRKNLDDFMHMEKFSTKNPFAWGTDGTRWCHQEFLFREIKKRFRTLVWVVQMRVVYRFVNI